MARFGSRFVQGAALLLIVTAVPVVLWVPRHDSTEGGASRFRAIGLAIEGGSNTPDRQITYRFLYRENAGRCADRLMLSRFQGRDLDEEAVWDFVDREQWYQEAPDIFARESGWVVEHQPGWQISRWLCNDGSIECDSDHLFWVLQALRLFDLQIFTEEITMLEASGCAIRICWTDGPSDYDYDADTLYWNPAETALVPRETSLDWKWFRTDPLVTLAHELGHAWHDLCRRGDAASLKEREQIAIVTENRIRHILFLKDPACAHLYPRPGYQETWPDLPGASAAEAWHNYHGIVRY